MRKNMKKIVIHQPNTFPRLKVLQKILASDLWIVYDNVQFVRREWQNRTKLRFLKDPYNSYWLTVPLEKSTYGKSLINSIKIKNYNLFIEKLYRKLWYSYKNSVYWFQIENYYNKIVESSSSSDLLYKFNTNTILYIFEMLDFKINYTFSSDFFLDGSKNEKIIKLCKFNNGNIYISGSGGINYLSFEEFRKNNIKIYSQIWNEKYFSEKYLNLFWKDISFIDFWARFGIDELKSILVDIKLNYN
jgi:hypothetical protein